MTATHTNEIADNTAQSLAGSKYSECYYLGDYERNGYHDSDGYVVFWDDKEGKIRQELFWTTRGGMDGGFVAQMKRDLTLIRERLASFIYERDLQRGTFCENKRVMEPEPNSLGKGVRVRFLKDSRKGMKTPWKAGECGTCFWQGWYGKFYSNGYNTKGRHNGRLGVKMDDGRTVWTSMTSVRLDCEPDLTRVEREAKKNAERLYIPCPGAWWTRTNPQLAATF